jgi:hypothetical protein
MDEHFRRREQAALGRRFAPQEHVRRKRFLTRRRCQHNIRMNQDPLTMIIFSHGYGWKRLEENGIAVIFGIVGRPESINDSGSRQDE